MGLVVIEVLKNILVNLWFRGIEIFMVDLFGIFGLVGIVDIFVMIYFLFCVLFLVMVRLFR